MPLFAKQIVINSFFCNIFQKIRFWLTDETFFLRQTQFKIRETSLVPFESIPLKLAYFLQKKITVL